MRKKRIQVTFDPAEFELLSRLAEEHGMLLSPFCRLRILQTTQRGPSLEAVKALDEINCLLNEKAALLEEIRSLFPDVARKPFPGSRPKLTAMN